MPSDLPSMPEAADPAAPGRAARKRRVRTLAPPPPANALAFTVPDTCSMARLGRTTIYKLVKDGRLRLVRVNGRSLICGDSLRALLAGGG